MFAPLLNDTNTAGCAATRGSMDCAGGQESLGLQVSPFSLSLGLQVSPLFFSIHPEGASSTGSLSGTIPEVEPDFTGNFYGTLFTSTWSDRGNLPAPDVMTEASQPLTPMQVLLTCCVNLAEVRV